MIKIMNNRKYDTDKAIKVGYWTNGRSQSDFYMREETLFRKKTGEYFIHAHGGAATQYAERTGTNFYTDGETIIPFSCDEARKWAEEKLTGEEYEKLFGEIDESEEKVFVHYRLKASTVEKLRRKAETESKKMQEIVQEALEKAL